MPRKKKSASATGDLLIASGRALKETEEESEDQQEGVKEGVEEGIESIPRRAYAEVYRVQANGELGYLGRVDERSLTQTMVADRWGGGDYRITLFGHSPMTGKWGKLKGRTIVIDPDVRPKREAPNPENGNGVAPSGLGGVMEQAMMSMMTFQQQQMQAFSQGQQQLQQMTMAVVASMIEGKKQDPVMGGILQALLAKQEKDPAETALQIIAAIKPTEKAGIGEMIEVFERLDALRGGGSAEPEDGVMKLGGKLVELAMTSKNNPEGKSELPGPLPHMVMPTEPPRPVVPLPLWHQMLHHYRGLLLDQARRGQDPGAVADLALQFIRDDEMGILTELLAAPDVVERIHQAVPDLHQFPSWTAKLVEAFRVGMAEAQSDELPQ